MPTTGSGSPIRSYAASANATFIHLGEFHRLKGIYGLLTGTFGIIAGVLLLDRADSVPLAVTSMAIGGFSIGLGLWEVKLGSTLKKNEFNFP
jgi:hypothetical protein